MLVKLDEIAILLFNKLITKNITLQQTVNLDQFIFYYFSVLLSEFLPIFST